VPSTLRAVRLKLPSLDLKNRRLPLAVAPAAADARAVDWWVHGVFALFWVSSIPFTKAVHMLAGPAGVAVKDDRAGNRLAPLPADAKAADVGYAFIDSLLPKHLLDLDACTKCGKCHAACPATATGYPLSPRDLVLDLREVAEGSMGNRAALGIAPEFPEHAQILGTIKSETLWSCMQCMACVEICPVGIEHLPILIGSRRGLVSNGDAPDYLGAMYNNLERRSNIWGLGYDQRTKFVQSAALETGARACAMTRRNASSSATSTVRSWRVPYVLSANGRLVHRMTLCESGSPEATPWG